MPEADESHFGRSRFVDADEVIVEDGDERTAEDVPVAMLDTTTS